MNSMFNPDNPFMRFLSRVGELIIVNMLFLICSIPVVTIGAAAAALQKVAQDIVFEEETPVVRTFFRGFRENFKQATAAWIVTLLFLLGMCANLLLIASYFSGNTAMVLNVLVLVMMAVIVGVVSHLYPLIVRYRNTLREHLMNACILAIIKLPRTVAMVVLNLLPLIIAFFSMEVLVSTMVFWVVVGFAFASYMCAVLMKPVFAELEKGDKSKIQIMN